MREISQEELYEYYVKENHTRIETQEHFNLCESALNIQLRKYNIKKVSDLTRDMDEALKDEITCYYVDENHSVEETCEKFGITHTILHNICKKPNEGATENAEKRWSDILKRISKDDLYNYYIVQNHTKKDTKDHFSISSEYQFCKLLKLYNINKYSTKEKTLESIPKQELVDFYINENHGREETMREFGVSQTLLTSILRTYDVEYKNCISGYEGDLKEILGPDIKIVERDRSILDGQEIDLYLPDYKIGIEFDGTYWHSSLFKERNYHLNKSKLAEEKGIRLIHIYEHEWRDLSTREKIISLINIATGRCKNRIYARNCDIREITNQEAKSFNEANHLQGHRNAQITYGLFYEGDLVQLMSFSKNKYNRNLKNDNSWEIIRGCPGSNNVVVGGVSKLFNHFIRDYHPDEVFSYCDFNKFDGKGYEAIGMKFDGYTGPDMKWILNFNPVLVVNRSPQNRKQLKEDSVAQIWGTGSKKYVWSSSISSNT